MEKVIVLGTGGGLTRKCYNTCFLLQDDDKYLLVDTGAGAQILNQIEDSGVKLNQIHDVFISHKHIDHLLGIIPLFRVICQDVWKNKYVGKVNVYCAKEDIVQYGFQANLNNGKIFTFLGDIPCSEKNYDKIKDTDWVCHEVFCRETEKEIFNPHKINHSTIKDVSENMQTLGVKNLILWHTKDNCIENRKELYTKEAKQYFNGNVYVPDDLDVIEL